MSLIGAIDKLVVGQMRILVKDQDVPQRLRLSVGDVLKGDVLKILPDGRALISFKGVNVVARPRVALSAGEQIFAQVQTLGSEIRLGLLSKQAKLQSEFLRTLGQAWQSNASMGKLADLLATAAATLRSANALRSSEMSIIDRMLALLGPRESADSASIADRLTSLARSLGLMHEASIARAIAIGTPIILLKRQLQKSLKPNLEKLVAMVSKRLAGEVRDAKTRANLERLLSLCADLYDNIEFQQLANHFLGQRGAQLYMQLPLLWMGESGIVELLVRSKKEDTKNGRIDPDHCQVSLLIDLSALGRIKALAAVNEASVSCLFATESKEVREFVVQHSELLAGGLQAVGFKAADVKAVVSAEPLPRQLEALGELLASQGPAFDVTA
ncbi:MAG: hypothetical protein JW759_04780 [Candidatus Coatesbacteria bacterium]|nr:hypothetical protein [Candidatus Coatesbacteria bacterium]